MMQVRLEPAALRSQVKHSTTEPLRSLCNGNNSKNVDTIFLYVLYKVTVSAQKESHTIIEIGTYHKIGTNSELIYER